MKLELKHLAAYLPYELKVLALKQRYPNFGGIRTDEKEFTMEGLRTNYLSVVGFAGMYLYYDFKPILRPFSDLTKDIEIKGKKFIPLIELGFTGCKVKSNYIENTNGYKFKITGSSYKNVQKLIEWHFDVFGLIDAGLAIDINTI